MCGISGLLSLDGSPIDRSRIERMTRSLAHRGPDDCGLFAERGIALGHRRLSIVDLAGGHQPMATEDGSLCITFNGEIFNYIELRKALRDRGYCFRTESDTEVILQLYREHGEDCVELLNGEWAFALWDSARRRLLLSRDRMGVRPLFYAVAGDTFAFASEIKALFQNPEIPRELDVEALDQFFTLWTPLTPRTMFKRVSEVPPAHSLVVADGTLRLRRYWHPHVAGEQTGHQHDVGALAEKLLDLLTDATRIRLRADVPVGAYLSGGLDSTVTAAIANRFTATGLRTFSVTFDDPAFDESAYQKHAVAHLGTQHESCHCTEEEIAQVLPDVIWHAEKPILRTAPAPLFLLARRVREQGFKVVMTGEGADETLGGYDIFREAKIRRFCSVFPESTRRPELLRRLYPYMDGLQAQPAAYLKAFFRVTADDCVNPFFSHLPRWALTARLKRFYSKDLRAALNGYDSIDDLHAQLPPAYTSWDQQTRAEHLETAHLLPGYILSSQGDRMAMAHGIEGRFPFLDHRVVEFAASLPARLKIRVLDEKYILKRASRDLVPSAILRRKKQPYRAPDASCFFRPGRPTPEYVEELLSPVRLSQDGLFNAPAVQRLVAKARTGQPLGVKDNMSLLGVLTTQLLVHRFIRTFPDARDRN